jgi:hypothetical protein
MVINDQTSEKMCIMFISMMDIPFVTVTGTTELHMYWWHWYRFGFQGTHEEKVQPVIPYNHTAISSSAFHVKRSIIHCTGGSRGKSRGSEPSFRQNLCQSRLKIRYFESGTSPFKNQKWYWTPAPPPKKSLDPHLHWKCL